MKISVQVPGVFPACNQIRSRAVLRSDPICKKKLAQNGESMWGNIVLVERGDCMFIEKARVLQVSTLHRSFDRPTTWPL